MGARARTEFSVAVPDRPGELARILELLAKAGVNVLAFVGLGEGSQGRVFLVPDDDRKTRKALADAGYRAMEAQVVCVTGASGKGVGAKLTIRLAKASANIERAYASTSEDGQSTAVFKVPDANLALEVLK